MGKGKQSVIPKLDVSLYNSCHLLLQAMIHFFQTRLFAGTVGSTRLSWSVYLLRLIKNKARGIHELHHWYILHECMNASDPRDERDIISAWYQHVCSSFTNWCVSVTLGDKGGFFFSFAHIIDSHKQLTGQISKQKFPAHCSISEYNSFKCHTRCNARTEVFPQETHKSPFHWWRLSQTSRWYHHFHSMQTFNKNISD